MSERSLQYEYKPLYECDPDKNIECTKSHCAHTHLDEDYLCKATSNIEYAKEPAKLYFHCTCIDKCKQGCDPAPFWTYAGEPISHGLCGNYSEGCLQNLKEAERTNV